MCMSSSKKVYVFVVFGCLSVSLFAKQENVLIIHSYHQGFKWTDSVNHGLLDGFQSKGDSVELFFEYLDMKRNFSDEYLLLMKDVFKIKSKYHNYSVIIVSDNKALNFILKNRSEFYPGIPIVFCGINGFKQSLLLGERNITGIAENSDEEGNIKLVKDLFPGIKNLYIINDNRTTTSRIVRQNLQIIEKSYFGRLKFHYWQDFSLKELNNNIQDLRPDSDALFITNYNIDKSDEFVTIQDLTDVLLNNAEIPTFGNRYFIYHDLSIGGLMEDAYGHGEAAAKMALDILDGIPADSIPIKGQGLRQYVFSNDKLKEYGIRETLLPLNSKVLKKSYGFFNVDKKIVIIGSLIFFFLVLIIVALTFVLRQKQVIENLLKKEKSQLRMNLDLQNLYSKLVSLFNVTNNFQIVIDEVLSELIEFYGFDRISLYSVEEGKKTVINKIVSGGSNSKDIMYEEFIKLERLGRIVQKERY